MAAPSRRADDSNRGTEPEGGKSQNETEAVSNRDSSRDVRHPQADAAEGVSGVRHLRLRRGPRVDALIDDRYRLVRYVARGATSTVWEAFDVRLEQRVALKVTPFAHDKGASPGKAERRTDRSPLLVGRHFPRVIDSGVEGSVRYLVLELLEGETLATRLEREGRLSIDACRWLGRELCAALGEAHELGVIHRDVTPENLMLVAGPGGEALKLLGVEVAGDARFRASRPAVLVGSPRFMSPEQAARGDVDERTDLWSAAVVLYRALVGRHPFPGDDRRALAWASMKPAVEPSSVVPELGRGVDRFFEIALSKRPAGRFGSAAQLAWMFDDALAQVIV